MLSNIAFPFTSLRQDWTMDVLARSVDSKSAP